MARSPIDYTEGIGFFTFARSSAVPTATVPPAKAKAIVPPAAYAPLTAPISTPSSTTITDSANKGDSSYKAAYPALGKFVTDS